MLLLSPLSSPVSAMWQIVWSQRRQQCKKRLYHLKGTIRVFRNWLNSRNIEKQSVINEFFAWRQSQMVRLTRYKTRLVIKSYTQKAGTDYTEIFTPVAQFESIRILLLLQWGNLTIWQFDIKLYGDLDETIFMVQLEGWGK